MEKDENRDIYIEKFDELRDTVELNTNFMDSLRNHEFFSQNMKTVEVSEFHFKIKFQKID